MRILFTTFGSYGDLYPYIAIGTELKSRGHEITVATSEAYRGKVQSRNLHFVPIRPDLSLDDREMLTWLFDAKRGSERVIRAVASYMRDTWADTLPAAEPADLIVTHPITFAAVLAARKLRLRWVSTVLAPTSFISIYDPPVLAPAPWLRHLRFLGPSFTKAIFAVGRWKSMQWMQPVLDLAREIDVEIPGNPLFEASFSPACVLALFSGILAPRQPDWPSQTVVTGFPFYDDTQAAMDPQLESFLRAGTPPIVFTLGSSAVGAAGRFYHDSLEAAKRLGARALFLTGNHPQGLPETLPEGMLAWPYAPHELVFPRGAVTVHQGGIGTTAQAMRSGRPMLIVPFAHDQFDNAERVRVLGAGEVLFRSDYSATRATAVLRRLINSPGYAESARRVGEVIRNENGTAAAADAIERLTTS